MLSNSLQTVVSLEQTLSTRQQASLRLLRMNALELASEIEAAIDENPLLECEVAAGTNAEESFEDEGWSREPEALQPLEGIYDAWGTPHRADDLDPFEGLAAPHSFRDDLRTHLRELDLTDAVLACGLELVDELDETGLLTTPLEEIAGDDPTGSRMRDLQAALCVLREADPAGIAQSGPLEAIAEELRRLEAAANDSHPDDRAACALLKQLFAGDLRRAARMLGGRDPKALLELAGGSEAVASRALELLGRLSPHPVSSEEDVNAGYVVPDLVVMREADRWSVRLTGASTPALRLAALAFEHRPDEARSLAPYLEEARFLIAALDARRKTLALVAERLVAHQQAFFDKGPAALRPLLQKDVAAELSLSESTVSRAVAGKFIQCPAGTIELKSLFCQAAASLEEASTAAVRARIASLIAAEDPARPLSDQALTDLLSAEGFSVSRRTIAKYREEAGIPSSSGRRVR